MVSLFQRILLQLIDDAFRASIMYLELNEIFKFPPSTSFAVTSSFTVPISGDVEDNSTNSFPVLNLITLFPPSRAKEMHDR